MSLPLKIAASAIGIAIIAALLLTLSSGIDMENLIDAYAFSAVPIGIVCTISAIISFATGKRNHAWAQGFLLGAGLLLLTGFFALSQISFGR